MIIGIPTMMAVTRRAAGLYLGGSRMSGVGSMTRSRGGGARGVTEGAAGLARECGEGARRGWRGRGMVVVRGFEVV
jgi:hypothetical protein